MEGERANRCTSTSTNTKAVLTSVLKQLGRIHIDSTPPSAPAATHGSKLANLNGKVAEQAKSAFLTLHFLFPHELLPALDLLDRKLVNKHCCRRQHHDDDDDHRSDTSSEVFYVQSASAVTDPVNRRTTTSRFRNAWNPTKVHYEVRLDSWNCTCAAFAQSSLKLLLEDIGEGPGQNQARVATHPLDAGLPEAWFGGIATSPDARVPVCKHILAAALSKAAPNLFSEDTTVRTVTAEETAAWSAGWGEI